MEHETYTIEMASIKDVNSIVRFQMVMARETEGLALDSHTVTKGVRRIFEEPDRGFYLVAKYNNHAPVGCLLILKEWSDWRNADVWWIHSVFIDPKHRQKGVFKRFFEYVEELARSSGIIGLRLYVEKTNSVARSVYSKHQMTNEHYELFEKMF